MIYVLGRFEKFDPELKILFRLFVQFVEIELFHVFTIKFRSSL